MALLFSTFVYSQNPFELLAKNEHSKILNNLKEGSDPNEYNYQLLRTDIDLDYNGERVNQLSSYFVLNKKNIPELSNIESLWEYEYSKIKGVKFGESVSQILIEDKIRKNNEAKTKLVKTKLKEIEEKIDNKKHHLYTIRQLKEPLDIPQQLLRLMKVIISEIKNIYIHFLGQLLQKIIH